MDQLQGKRKTKGNPFALLAEEGDEAAATSVYRKDTKKKTRSKRQQDKLLKPGGDNEEQRSNPAAIKDLEAPAGPIHPVVRNQPPHHDTHEIIRPVPYKGDRIVPFIMCLSKDSCTWGNECEYAHNEKELEQWEEERKRKMKSKKNRIRPIREGYRAELCQNRGCSDDTCPYAHGEVELKAWKTAFGNYLLGHAVTVKAEKGESYMIDPFLIGCLDFQRRFTDSVTKALLLTVQAVFKDQRGSQRNRVVFLNVDGEEIDPSTEEGKKDRSIYDFYRLVEHIKRHHQHYASHLNTSPDHIGGICSDLLRVRNSLAHAVYLAHDQTREFTVQRTLRFTAQYLDRGLEIMTLIRRKHKKDEWIFENADQLRMSFTEYTIHSYRVRQYTTKSAEFDEKKRIAEKTVQELQRLIGDDDEPTIDFINRSIAPRMDIPDSTVSSRSEAV